jgi:tRNA-2-methylthio-N6-dimethylallyladenosine synthase
MRYFVITYGCQMNKSDSERIAAMLEKAGYKPAKNEKQADLIVINVCSVRQSAVDRIYGKIRNLTELKNSPSTGSGHKKIIILTGCVLPQDKEKFKDKVDLILNVDEWKKIPNSKFQISNEFRNPNFKTQNTRYETQDTNYFHIQPRYAEKFRAFVPIMTGCNYFCSYCVVPYVRGREVSRDVQDVLNEVKQLVKNGCLEITLLGQNVNAYRPSDVENFSKNNSYVIARRSDKVGPTKQSRCSRGGEDCHAPSALAMTTQSAFAALLWEINQIPGIERVHFTAPHPRDMSDEVIDALTLPKMVNYLHLPVQSGDDKVLQKMNRNYTARDYIKLVEKIRKKKPAIALGTDIIVGFPGETKKQFENTVKLYKKADFDIAYLAIYSPRERTVAAKLVDDVPRQEKKRRRDVLQNLMEKIVFRKNQKYIGKKVSVLVDDYKDRQAGHSEKQDDEEFLDLSQCSHSRGIPRCARNDGWCIGNSREMKRVRFLGKKSMVGKIFDVKIKKAFEWILEG